PCGARAPSDCGPAPGDAAVDRLPSHACAVPARSVVVTTSAGSQGPMSKHQHSSDSRCGLLPSPCVRPDAAPDGVPGAAPPSLAARAIAEATAGQAAGNCAHELSARGGARSQPTFPVDDFSSV